MPITERCKKAKPLHVWTEYQKLYASFAGVFPKPTKSETFTQYRKRIAHLWSESAAFVAAIEAGCTTDGSEVNQRNYLFSISDIADEMVKLRNAMQAAYPGR